MLLRRGYAVLLLCSSVSQAAESIDALSAGMEAYRAQQWQLAKQHWMPLAEQGDPTAQLYLAYLHKRALGNAQQARYWYQQAAQNGVPEAQYQLGLSYELGLGGLTADANEANYWYGQALGSDSCPTELPSGGELGD